MTQSHRSAHDVLTSIKKQLSSAWGKNPAEVLDEIVEELHEGRHYFWTGLYLAAGDKVVRQCFRGPVPPCHSFQLGVGNVGTTGQKGVTKIIPDVSADPTYSMCFLETKSEIVVPVKIGTRILGVIDVESDRLNGFSSQERALLEQTAEQIARFLTTDQGKLLLRKAREQSAKVAAETEPHKAPKSERPEKSRAAAGDRVSR